MSVSRAYELALHSIAERIRAARGAVRLTQEEAAARAHIDYKRYQRIEAGEVNVTVKTLVRIAVALDTSIHAFVSPKPRAASR